MPGGRAVAYDKAREAAREKNLSRYIKLTCGHYTTWETDERYSVFRPGKNKFFCEEHGKWTERVKKDARKSYPQEPLF